MSDTIKELIKRFDKHRVNTDARFQFILDRQKNMEKALVEMQEESSDFYSFVAASLGELDQEITQIKEKIKGL
ncbi:MAG: hypothetical protein RIF33_09945 [Cyclobacteriaceae bacterium]